MGIRGTAGQGEGLGIFQYLTLALGCMIGVAWIPMLGEWIGQAGPIGAMAGFLLGGTIMLGVSACYAEMSSMMPVNGGEVVFVERAFGADAAMVIGLFLVLAAISVAAFEAVSLAWVLESLYPLPDSHALYQIAGTPVTCRQITLGLVALAVGFGLNARAIAVAGRAQAVLTTLKAIIILVFIVVGLSNARPGLVVLAGSNSGDPALLGGFLWVTATSALWLGGFQVIGQAAGDRRSGVSLRAVSRVTIVAVALGVGFYVSVIFVAASHASATELVRAPLAAAYVARLVLRSEWGASAVLIAGAFGLLATLNGMLISGSRILTALAQRALVPAMRGRGQNDATSMVSLAIIVGASAVGVLAGKAAIIPVVTTASLSIIASYVMTCAAAFRLRRTAATEARPFRVPGGKVVIAMTTISIAAMGTALALRPLFSAKKFPVEWVIMAVWAAIATGMAGWRRRR